jgi:hypothetical protein
MKKMFIFMVIGLMGCVGNDNIPQQQPDGGPQGSGPVHGHTQSLYGYCLELASSSIKRRWKDYMSSNDHIENNHSPLYCERFAESPRKLLESAQKNPRNDGRDGASYHGGYGGQTGRAGSGAGGGRAGSGGAGIYGGVGGKGGDGGNAY